MTLSIKRYVVPKRLLLRESWRLVEWCKSIGADEFTIDLLAIDSAAANLGRLQFEEMVGPFSLGSAVRERMSGRTADDLTRPTERWALNQSSLGALNTVLPDGIFHYQPQQGAWFENPILYREGGLMLGVLSHEAFAVLRLGIRNGSIEAAGFLTHDSLPRIG